MSVYWIETTEGILYKAQQDEAGWWVTNEDYNGRVGRFNDWPELEQYFQDYLTEPIKTVENL